MSNFNTIFHTIHTLLPLFVNCNGEYLPKASAKILSPDGGFLAQLLHCYLHPMQDACNAIQLLAVIDQLSVETCAPSGLKIILKLSPCEIH